MKLEAEKINAIAGRCRIKWHINVEEVTGSTSDCVRNLGREEHQEGCVVFAEHQTNGRGRREKIWIAAAGRDLMFSVLLRPKEETSKWTRITTLAALAICKGIANELPVSPQIKWPNDIYIKGRKVCGILAETHNSVSGPYVVLGIGINVNTLDFPDELQASAGSLSLMLDMGQRQIDRNLLAGALLRSLDYELSRTGDDEFPSAMEEVRKYSWLTGRTIRGRVDGVEFFGRAIDLNHEGHLVVIFSDGTRSELSSAENVRSVV